MFPPGGGGYRFNIQYTRIYHTVSAPLLVSYALTIPPLHPSYPLMTSKIFVHFHHDIIRRQFNLKTIFYYDDFITHKICFDERYIF